MGHVSVLGFKSEISSGVRVKRPSARFRSSVPRGKEEGCRIARILLPGQSQQAKLKGVMHILKYESLILKVRQCNQSSRSDEIPEKILSRGVRRNARGQDDAYSSSPTEDGSVCLSKDRIGIDVTSASEGEPLAIADEVAFTFCSRRSAMNSRYISGCSSDIAAMSFFSRRGAFGA